MRPATTAFALAFAAATLALFAATIPPSAYAAAACDALSIVQVTAIGIGGVGLALLASRARAQFRLRRRFAGAAVLGRCIVATMALAFPACLGDPYAQLDPRLATLWLDHVSEARSVLALLRDLPQEVLPYYGLIAGGLAVGLYRCLRERGNARWTWIASRPCSPRLPLSRSGRCAARPAANAIAVALVPAALVLASDDGAAPGVLRSRPRGADRGPAVQSAVADRDRRSRRACRELDQTGSKPRPTVIADGPGTCRRAADYAPLASLPRGLVVGFIDAGPFILMETPHSALAAPYHRNIKGNAAMFDVFLAPPQEAVARMSSLGVDYIAFCPGSPERYTYAAAAPDGLAAALGRGEVPDSLERVALDRPNSPSTASSDSKVVYRPQTAP